MILVLKVQLQQNIEVQISPTEKTGVTSQVFIKLPMIFSGLNSKWQTKNLYVKKVFEVIGVCRTVVC